MSAQADAVKKHMKKYVDTMRGLGKEPSAIYVTKDQYDILRAAAKAPVDNFNPRFMNIEVVEE